MTQNVISLKRVKKAIDNAVNSNVAKSVRRIYFTGLLESTKKRGYWHTDIMSGMGSGILIRMNDTFFLITAKHVLKDLLNYYYKNKSFPNESPFWIDVCHKPNWETLHNFLMPKKIWNIGELINIEAKVITSDVVLVELFYPAPFHYPDHFIDITNKSQFLEKTLFYTGQFLLVSGYPFEKNNYNWTVNKPNFTHSTIVHRVSYLGEYIDDSNIGFISFKTIKKEITHKNSNGMSGGIVYNIQEKSNNIKLCRMILTLSNNICYFLPSYLLKNAILNYKKTNSIIVDPIINQKNYIRQSKEYFEKYLNTFSPKNLYYKRYKKHKTKFKKK